MRALVVSILVLFGSLVLFSSPAAAINIVPGCSSGSAATSSTTNLNSTKVCSSVNSQTASNSNPILKALKKTIDIISLIIGVASIIVIIIAGIQFIVSSGNPQSVSNARNSLIFALVGIFIVVLAQTIVVFVIDNVLK